MLEIQALRALQPDGHILLVMRMVRLSGFGAVSVILALYFEQFGLTREQIGLLLTATLIGDAVLSLWIAGVADRVGRRRMLQIGAGLMIFAGLALGTSGSVWPLIVASVIGTLSPTGNEVGAFISIEQAALPQTTTGQHRTSIFAWYNLGGSFATALGALAGGAASGALQAAGLSPLDSYRVVLLVYTLLGAGLFLLVLRLSPAVEAPPDSHPAERRLLGLYGSRPLVVRLAGLFMIDAFGGGLVVQSWIVFWFHLRFGVDPALLGAIFFGANIFAGLSSLAAARIAARFGLINTMVWTHIPSNALLMLVPLMPSLPLAVAVLLARFSISQMDVPTRQSYIMAVVEPNERSAAAALTTVARTAASAVAPSITGMLLAASLFSAPFLLAGGIKIVYDLGLYRSFRALKPPEEQPAAP